MQIAVCKFFQNKRLRYDEGDKRRLVENAH